MAMVETESFEFESSYDDNSCLEDTNIFDNSHESPERSLGLSESGFSDADDTEVLSKHMFLKTKNGPSEHDFLSEELRKAQQLNLALCKIKENLSGTRIKLQHFSNTVGQTESLLNVWSKLLSQTQHTQKLLSDSNWEGVSHDKMRIEQLKAEKERREREARERREREERKKIEQEQALKAMKNQQEPASRVANPKMRKSVRASVMPSRRLTAVKPGTRKI
ncbi:hypothetical protein K493DRAFT_310959 [Basidiobolus meristosporus CBS 931.73]|uniref:DASH complex subunit DUO1 n=1 Tax=Basidiobolus meristosporus CBS 931.73 TaxID=1314790 RepID=A0A1Y1Z597_9FUNG|nr:hypothetical protein K493DRAFT_310959 [Basidiobolus meristosporus CBS 931.73]|eukprot:ORY05419.1 hypothetical protein K493DRAFT_310959 [Basidiobolus meristosporus CBS 931.73]